MQGHILHRFWQDFAWLELINESRVKDGLETISEDVFELAMDRFEKESVFQCEFSTSEGGRQAAVDEDAACSVCGSGDVGTDNNILFCDLCNIAVHQVMVISFLYTLCSEKTPTDIFFHISMIDV